MFDKIVKDLSDKILLNPIENEFYGDVECPIDVSHFIKGYLVHEMGLDPSVNLIYELTNKIVTKKQVSLV